MIHLTSVELNNSPKTQDCYPFNVISLQTIEAINFKSAITYFIGENGTGKSTLLEGIAANSKSIYIGNKEIDQEPTLHGAREFGEILKLVWKNRTHKGFFLRAEDVVGFSRRIRKNSQDLQNLADKYTENDYGSLLARNSILGQKKALAARYGEDIDFQSHGETFLSIFKSRFVPNGLYLLDEPETPLSFKNQLALISLLREMVKQGAQFIIATHSPILTAMPEAQIYAFSHEKIKTVIYEEIEQFSLMKDFLNSPGSFLKYL